MGDRAMADRLPRRAGDRIADAAAGVLVTLGLLVAVLAVAVGVDAQARSATEARLRDADQVEVTATVVEDTPFVPFAPEAGTPQLVPAQVTWTDRAGARQEAQALVPAMSRAGQPVRIRVDGAGRVVTDVAPELSGLGAAVVLAGCVLVSGWLLLGTAWLGVRALTARVNDRAWTREWARVGPGWTGHGGDHRRDAGGRRTD